MIDFILQFLRESLGLKLPFVFEYTSTKMLMAAITSLAVSIFLGPCFIKKLYELKIGQSIRKEECPLLGELHAKKQNTPTMGGILILAAMLISMFLWMNPTNIFTILLFLTTLCLGCLGGVDDYFKLKYRNAKGLRGKKKLLVQLLLAGGIAGYLLFPSISHYFEHQFGIEAPTNLIAHARAIYIPFYKEPLVVFSGISILVVFVFMIFVMTGASNAVNLTDGLDGLAAGCLLMVALCLAAVAFVSNNKDLASYLNILYIEGSGEIAIYLSALAGGCLGFLWYNGHPAQLFMGDTGSLALGGVIGVSAIFLKREFLLAIIGGIFVVEALSVIGQVLSFRLRNKKRIFLCAPLHHHFEYKGWPETKVVLRFWIVGFLLAVIGMASLKFQ